MVSEYECRTVAKQANLTWPAWLELDELERALCVAHQRVSSAIEANVAEAQAQHYERQAKKSSRRR